MKRSNNASSRDENGILNLEIGLYQNNVMLLLVNQPVTFEFLFISVDEHIKIISETIRIMGKEEAESTRGRYSHVLSYQIRQAAKMIGIIKYCREVYGSQ